MNKEQKLIEIAKKFIECNPNSIGITGTLMLKLRGIDLGREINDLDLIVNDLCPNVEFPKDLDLEELGHASDFINLKYKVDDIKIDILSSNEKIEIVDGLPLGNLSNLLEHKYIYCNQNNPSSKKHYDDLVKLGFDFSGRITPSFL